MATVQRTKAPATTAKRGGNAATTAPAPLASSGGATATRAPAPGAVAQRAYEIWQESGCPDGKDQEHWFRAERELRGAPPAR